MKKMIGAILVLTLLAILFVLYRPGFGKLPQGERLERIKRSPNYRDGAFRNQSPTQMMVYDKSKARVFWEFLFVKPKGMRPAKELPAVKTDLNTFDPDEEVLVWMGHSSLYLQTSGKRFLVDPVLVSASPVSFVNKAFPGTSIYRPQDMPAVDFLLITHDHWDHLDHKTVLHLKHRIGKIICPLGVGAHFEYWGFPPDMITELDWHDQVSLDGNIKLTALPARHFSGRGLRSNQTLWAGYMLQSGFGNILLSGDTGYDTHFQEIKRRFGDIDLAIMENGQYNTDWKYIHTLPDDLVKAVSELQPRKLLTVHNSKFALAKHPWEEPLQKISEAAEEQGFNLITPKIGEPVFLRKSDQVFSKWWLPNGELTVEN